MVQSPSKRSRKLPAASRDKESDDGEVEVDVDVDMHEGGAFFNDAAPGFLK